jgi:hypothetical protein
MSALVILVPTLSWGCYVVDHAPSATYINLVKYCIITIHIIITIIVLESFLGLDRSFRRNDSLDGHQLFSKSLPTDDNTNIN